MKIVLEEKDEKMFTIQIHSSMLEVYGFVMDSA